MKPDPQFVQYVFLDIVAFSHERSVEAQADLVSYLNHIVRTSLTDLQVPPESVVLLPTGDGMCIVLIGHSLAYDLHLNLGLRILVHLREHNDGTSDQMRRFEMRVGLNQNVDNVVVDINDRRNVAGAGINMAQRIMDKADGNQILVGSQVHDTLGSREAYMRSFRSYSATVKHGLIIPIYQFVAENHVGLNIATPSAFRPSSRARPRLSEYQAFYIALALAERNAIAALSAHGSERYSACVLLHLLSLDGCEKLHATVADPATTRAPGSPDSTFAERVQLLEAQHFWLVCELADFISKQFAECADCFESAPGGCLLFVTPIGDARLRDEQPGVAAAILQAIPGPPA